MARIASSSAGALLLVLSAAAVAVAAQEREMVLPPSPSPLPGAAAAMPASAAVVGCSLLFALVAPLLLSHWFFDGYNTGLDTGLWIVIPSFLLLFLVLLTRWDMHVYRVVIVLRLSGLAFFCNVVLRIIGVSSFIYFNLFCFYAFTSRVCFSTC